MQTAQHQVVVTEAWDEVATCQEVVGQGVRVPWVFDLVEVVACLVVNPVVVEKGSQDVGVRQPSFRGADLAEDQGGACAS